MRPESDSERAAVAEEGRKNGGNGGAAAARALLPDTGNLRPSNFGTTDGSDSAELGRLRLRWHRDSDAVAARAAAPTAPADGQPAAQAAA